MVRRRCLWVCALKAMVTSFLILFLSANPCLAAEAQISLFFLSPLKYDHPRKTTETDAGVELIKLIDGAHKTIDFAIYGIRGQDAIMDAILKAKGRGVQVRGVVDSDVNGKHYYTDTDKLIALLKDVRTDQEKDLKTKGFFDASPKKKFNFTGDLMHDKFFVIDARFVWTGSANISDTCVGGYNANIVGIIDSEEIAGWYTQEFDLMYGGQFHRDKGRTGVPGYHCTEKRDVCVYFSPHGWAIKNAVVPAIDNAKKSIDIAMFYLTDREVAAKIIMAHRRGVKIRMIMDATGVRNKYSQWKIFRDAGIPVKVENWGGKMHMKAAVIDGEALIFGSMNWTKAGASKNDENTIVTYSQELSKEFSDFYETLWSSIPDKWLKAAPAPESLDSGSSCRDGIDNDFDHLIDAMDPGCTLKARS